jgi:RsiW-degrading membrane proteinase PrsW (M82 family)
MICLGPVYEAARGGNQSPSFNLVVAIFVLAFAWLGYFKRRRKRNISLWIPIAISAICAVLIGACIWEFFR